MKIKQKEPYNKLYNQSLNTIRKVYPPQSPLFVYSQNLFVHFEALPHAQPVTYGPAVHRQHNTSDNIHHRKK